jgi:predicted nicotinamide N-methyase
MVQRDAGLGFLMYFTRALSPIPPDGATKLAALLKSSKVRRLRVLELGAGCGIVGVALAQLVKCDMLLTDLDDAQEILASNLQCGSPLAGSTIKAEVLDWASSLDDSSNANYDLILVSDCIYNPDSSVHLVETLRQLATRTPNVLVLVGFKRRHEADTIFFERMQETNFNIAETLNIPLPHTITEQDTEPPLTEFYTYTFQPPPKSG